MVTDKQKANLKRFSSSEARENGKKGAEKSNALRKARKEVLDVFSGAVANTTQEDLMEAFKTIQEYAKQGSLPHWQEWLRLIGQEDKAETEVVVTFANDINDLSL